MKALQEITGLSVADQQRIRDEQQADARFKLHLSQMNETEAGNLQEAMMVYQSLFGQKAANELKDRIVNFGDITTATLEKTGDLISRIVLVINLQALTSTKKWGYVDKIGHAIIDNVRISIGDSNKWLKYDGNTHKNIRSNNNI